jgi:hypothetical protein
LAKTGRLKVSDAEVVAVVLSGSAMIPLPGR